MDVKIIHPALLKRGSEELLLWLDDTLIHTEHLGEPVESVEGGAGFQVVGLQGEFDVHDLSVGAQHIPGRVHFDEHKLVIRNLGGNNRNQTTSFPVLKHRCPAPP